MITTVSTIASRGVWVVWHWSDGRSVLSVHADELEAYKAAVEKYVGCSAQVTFVAFGVEMTEALK